ncbi:hypothetical protein E8E11_005580 [Didymella keratinophila]|nr:hypothetical protein E8E11_005580 [Didymella keratinophila]
MSSQTLLWFITAASSGFGNTSRNTDLKKKGAVTVTLNVTAPQEVIEKVAKDANDQYGYINHLVNAAGYILVGAIEETSPNEDFGQFNTNVFGMLNVSKAFLPYLRASCGHRTISNLGSVGSWRGGAGFGLYAGTKWACSGISESMRSELAPLGIVVAVIEPGYFRTGFLNAGAQIKSGKNIKEYDETAVGQVRARLDQVDNNQPGDVVKGARVIVDILTKTGAAEGKEVPLRVVLGSDCSSGIREKIEETVKLLDEWDHITTMTNHE